MMVESFIVNELYSHEEAYRSLGLGNAGGVRFVINSDGSTKRAVLFTSVPSGRLQSENPYYDRIENDVLVYTAQGRKGEQGFGGQNQRLLTHGAELYPIYCFQLICSRRDKTVGVKRWRFMGFLFGLRRYKEQQHDVFGELRNACIFEFAVISDFSKVIVSQDAMLAKQLYREYARKNGDSFEEGEMPIRVQTTQTAGYGNYSADELERIRAQMLNLHPARFESLVKNVLEHSGFCRVATTRYSQDGGIDVDAFAGEWQWPIRSLHVQIQAKRWMHTVGRKEVAELRGSLGRYARGALVTTSQFSKSALDEADNSEKLPITMIDGYDFARIIKHFNVVI